MKHIILLILAPLLLSSHFTMDGKTEPEAQTYLKLYTTVTGTGDNKEEKWLLANNGTRRILATIEVVSATGTSQPNKEQKNMLVEPKSSVVLGIRSANGSAPNTIVIIKAVFTAAL